VVTLVVQFPLVLIGLISEFDLTVVWVGGAGGVVRRCYLALLTFLWVDCHDHLGSGGQSPPRVRSAMAMRDSGLW
jgi:hypothetical protein